MRIRGIGRLRRIAQPYTNFFFPASIILAYHRVADLACDPQLLAVTPHHFAEHVQVLRNECHPIRLHDLSTALCDGRSLPRGVIVTFDDGYADNLINAKPVLERYDVPATVFVTTGYTNKKRDFWWNELEALLLHRELLPKTLRLHIDGRVHDWDLSLPVKGDGTVHGQYRRWNILDHDDPSPRHSVYRSLHKMLRPLVEYDQRKVLDELSAWAGAEDIGQASGTVLSRVQVIELAQGGLVEVGSHSVTHPMCSALPLSAQRAEIQRSKSDLEDILGRPVTSFSYPFGAKSDYTEETAAAVEQAGYLCACSNFPAVVRRHTDRFQLPRFLVRDWDGEEFSQHLRTWLTD
jgi:peptidoglycan/xylan/chitin deacetylase (PgdA/CDA1 family)